MKTMLLIVLTFSCTIISAQNDSGLILVETSDKGMDKAFQEAKKTLDGYIKNATINTSQNEVYGAYIKVKEDELTEYLWVSGFEKYDDKYFMGVLITKPELITQFDYGDTIGFKKEDIFDWQIYNTATEELKGAFTIKYLDNKN